MSAHPVTGFTDLHCHWLPGVDDGARTLEDGLALARAAADDGITTAVMTPHILPGRYENSRSRLAGVFERYRQAVAAAVPGLSLRLGSEVRLSVEMLTLLDLDEVPMVGQVDDRRYLLLEMPDGFIPAGMQKVVERLVGRSLVPIIAHPERNKDVMRAPDRMRAFVDAGCVLQVTAGSITGEFGRPAQAAAQALLESGFVTFVASDAHNLQHRPPRMRAAWLALVERYGADAANSLTIENPAAIVCDPTSAEAFVGAAAHDDARETLEKQHVRPVH